MSLFRIFGGYNVVTQVGYSKGMRWAQSLKWKWLHLGLSATNELPLLARVKSEHINFDNTTSCAFITYRHQ